MLGPTLSVNDRALLSKLCPLSQFVLTFSVLFNFLINSLYTLHLRMLKVKVMQVA